jgi:ATP-dependent helicase/nuclease subunit B
MAEALRPSLFTVPFGEDLCAATVSAILDRASGDPLALIQTLIFLPNNRAIRAMTEAFVRRASPGLLLPRMVAVGDLSLDEALGPLLDPFGAAETILPVIPPIQRTLLLAGLVRKHRGAQGVDVNATEALRLGCYLGEVIDELEIEQIRFSRFDVIKPEEDLAGHWQNSYAQLLGMIPDYDAELRTMKLLGPAARRNLLLAQLAQSLRQNQPKHLVVAAGISTAAPAIAGLLRQIALLPQSMVVLPAIDLTMDDALWEKLGPHAEEEGSMMRKFSHETHPQFHLKLLLDRMGFQRSEVGLLSGSVAKVSDTITDIFCLPDDTQHWRNLPAVTKRLPHVRLITAEESSEEARVIAVLVRGALEIPEQRIAVITPDRELAIRVAAQLKRWNIHVDDSAGTPLTQTPPSTLFMALAQAMQDRFGPVSILAVAKHPLVKFGEERLAWLEQSRVLDIILRGPGSGIGLAAISERIAKHEAEERKKGREPSPEFVAWWNDFAAILKPLDAAADSGLLDINTALQTAASALTDGNIWKGVNGRQLATFLGELSRYNLSALGQPKREAIVSVLTELFGREVVRPPYGGHPRVAIYGLLEARLQQADLLICAGLNEGTWPQLPQPDPWLAPRIRRELGLAAPERNIGLSAHDLASALGAKQIVLTRAKRDRGGPTVASRFLLRIQALLGEAFTQDDDAAQLARLLETPAEHIKYPKPVPMPSARQRMVQLSVTDFDRLKADPYAFYANKILRLKVLDPVDAEPGPAWRGTIVHDILEAWAKEDDCDPAKLMQRAGDLLTNPAVHPALRALWQPRIAEGLRWVAERTLQLRDEGRTVLAAEVSGHTDIGGVRVKGRADRIDQLADGGISIVDYKTGSPPKVKQVSAGYSLQLGLIGLIAQEGGIKGVAGDAKAFEYWSLAKSAKGSFGHDSNPVVDKVTEGRVLASDFVAFAHDQALDAIVRLITGSDAFVAKKHPEYAPYADYDQLMRFEEWNGREPISDEAGV